MLNKMNTQFTQKTKLPDFLLEYQGEDLHIQKNPSTNTDIYYFDPYNSLNTQIEESDVRLILSKYGINVPIFNLNLYRRAFVHRSYVRHPMMTEENHVIISPKPANCLAISSKSNERLEFVGDGILECITKYYLYRRFPNEDEGFMTEKKIALVKNESIGKIAYEMGLHKWFVLSKNSEIKEIRSNFKKLGCLFEAFIGAMFLDFNKISVNDEGGWFRNMFLTGPGFQMVQIFVENVFEKHVDFDHLIRNDDNYKKFLQMMIQKEFKVTPHYLEMSEHTLTDGYHMGVFLCLGQHIHEAWQQNGGNNGMLGETVNVKTFSSFMDIHDYMSKNNKLLLFLGDGKNKVKKKAEQLACENAIITLKNYG